MKNKLLLLVATLIIGVVAVGGWKFYELTRPILTPTVHGQTYDSVTDAVEEVVKYPIKDNGYPTKLLVFYDNDCKYCRGGIGGVLETYQELPKEDQARVNFFDLDTERGLSVAKSVGATKTSQMAVVSLEKPEPMLYNYATKNQRPDTKAVKEAVAKLKEWTEDYENEN